MSSSHFSKGGPGFPNSYYFYSDTDIPRVLCLLRRWFLRSALPTVHYFGGGGESVRSRPKALVLVRLLLPSSLIVFSVVHVELQCKRNQVRRIVLGFLTDDPFFRISIVAATPTVPEASTIPAAPLPTCNYHPLHWEEAAGISWCSQGVEACRIPTMPVRPPPVQHLHPHRSPSLPHSTSSSTKQVRQAWAVVWEFVTDDPFCRISIIEFPGLVHHPRRLPPPPTKPPLLRPQLRSVPSV